LINASVLVNEIYDTSQNTQRRLYSFDIVVFLCVITTTGACYCVLISHLPSCFILCRNHTSCFIFNQAKHCHVLMCLWRHCWFVINLSLVA